MTPDMLDHLAELLFEFDDWFAVNRPASLDSLILDEAYNIARRVADELRVEAAG